MSKTVSACIEFLVRSKFPNAPSIDSIVARQREGMKVSDFEAKQAFAANVYRGKLETVTPKRLQRMCAKEEERQRLEKTARLPASRLSGSSTTSGPLPRQRWQENEILRVIDELGHKPMELPKWTPGNRGVKAKVREKLKGRSWLGTRFNKAWDRLRSDGRIREAT